MRLLNKRDYLGLTFLTVILFGFIIPNLPVNAQKSCRNMNTQADMNICAVDKYKLADSQLNSAYQKLFEAVSPEWEEKLNQAQLAWMQFREHQCLFELTNTRGGRANGVEGSMAPVIRYSCLRFWTEKRTSDITQYLQSQFPQPKSNQTLEESERALNTLYQSKINTMSGETQSNLKATQSSWSRFRDKNCQFEVTFSATAQDLCLRRITQERTEWFSSFSRE